MHLKPVMFLKLGSFLPRFVFNNKCLEFAYFKVEVVSYIMYFLSRNGSSIKNTGIKKGVSLPIKFLRLIFSAFIKENYSNKLSVFILISRVCLCVICVLLLPAGSAKIVPVHHIVPFFCHNLCAGISFKGIL